MKKSLVLIFALFLITGCSMENKSEKIELQKVSIMLDWYPNAVHSFLYAADENGYFKKNGIEIDIKMPADTNDPLKLVAADEVDIAISYQPQVLIARGQDIPVRSFGALVRSPLNSVMVPADSSIKSPKEFVGKKIGYPSIPLNDAMINTMVKTAGGDPTKVELVDVGWNLIPTIATKKVDAIAGGFINHEKLLLEKEGHEVNVFSPTEFGVPNYYELVLVASEEGLEKNKEIYEKFVQAVTEGQKYVTENPEKGLNLLLKHEDKTAPLDKEVEKKSLEILIPLMDAGDKPFLYQEISDWNSVADWLLQNKVIKKSINSKDAFINLN
jgi:putative hydroxymethylpyrimidine transport system substrate-binding protein